MKKFRITLRDTREDRWGRLNPTAKNIIVEVKKEKELNSIIVEKATELFGKASLEFVGFAYIAL